MPAAQNIANRTPITVAIMLATLIITLDSTIANVALPHIQGSLSASPDQIAWVLTSYIVAAAIMTPLSGWISNRFGVKNVLLVTVTGFTVASMLCGVASNLPELVLFRILQGGFGAFSMPLSQAVLLDINPPKDHARAMSLWAMGTILGPILGPVLGGFITEQFSWRWCFYINAPVGAVTVLMLWVFMASDPARAIRRFDFLGFGSLTLGVAALQLMLDRGPSQDWFSSPEIWTEALLALAGFWVFVIHTVTTDHPFIDMAVLRDRNLIMTSAFSFLSSGVMFGAMAVQPIIMQSLMGYPVQTSGMVSMPRGVGMFLAMWVAPRLANFIDLRALMALGLAANSLAMWQMAHFDLSMSPDPLMIAGFVQGAGQGLLFVPVTTLAFATISPALRPEGAAVYNLVRSLGGSLGISIVQGLATTNSQVAHASLAARVTPDDPVVRSGLSHIFSPQTTSGLAALDLEIGKQANMIAYLDDFRMLLVVTLICAPLILLLQKPKGVGAEPAHGAME
jgi:DHA2 family multidrug resistance protein